MYLSALKRLPDGVCASAESVAISEGRQGTFETLKMMCALVREWKKNIHIRDLALQLTASDEEKNFYSEIESVFNYVRDQIRYTQDTTDVEGLNTPDLTIQLQAGDCDDKAVLLSALLESIGHKCAFRAVGFDNCPESLSHVLVLTKVGSEWVSLDATEHVRMGWQPPGVTDQLIVYC